MDKESNAGRIAELICGTAKRKILLKAVFSKPTDKTVAKMVLTPKIISNAECLQAEFFTRDNKALHKNIQLDENAEAAIKTIAAGFGQINLFSSGGNCEYRRSKSGNSLIIGNIDFSKGTAVGFEENNRRKNYILDGSETFLFHLGISDANGRVHDKKQSKFRQINRFLEYVRDIENLLPSDDIYILDLCCGKSYLTFAVYHYFANIRKIKVSMTGTDLKADVIAECSEIAEKTGFAGLDFRAGDIKCFVPERRPDLVISLHACDTATDVVLDTASKLGASVILSTPCCHHELFGIINCPPLSFIERHSILKQKLCEAATDALRLMLLESRGYEVCALELIDPEDTPKNVLLKAIKRQSFDENNARALLAEYEKARNFLIMPQEPKGKMST